jgi:AAA family ATP:ADP antiporter
MPQTSPDRVDAFDAALGRIAHVDRREIPSLIWSFVFFFCVLAGYYVIRPVREEMGVRIGREWLQTLFVVVFFIMLAVVPLFGWVVSRFEKRHIVPVVYAFFIAWLAIFSLLMNGRTRGADGRHLLRLGQYLQLVCRVPVLERDGRHLHERTG